MKPTLTRISARREKPFIGYQAAVALAERGLRVDHSTIGRWVLRYAPELHKRIRRDTRNPNCSWRVDETYVRVAAQRTYLYRAVDSTGETIDFLLSPKRDAVAAKHFLQMAMWRVGGIRPRVINVDGHAAYPQAIRKLKASGELGRQCKCRLTPYLNNVLEQRSSIREETHGRQPVVPIHRGGVADHIGL